MSLHRREFFAILGACAASAREALAQHGHQIAEAALDLSAYRPRALSPAEYELLNELLETLLPADETGPGARDAHVAFYIDTVLKYAPSNALQTWKTGLAGVGTLANERFQQPFTACSDSQRQEIMAELAKNEMTPETALDGFFAEFKQTAIEGFYASELIQREHLGYKGNTAVAEFPGCTHPNFEHPDTAQAQASAP
jgi:gluconate 2-dehydrogenase subunit 3-like protein